MKTMHATRTIVFVSALMLLGASAAWAQINPGLPAPDRPIDRTTPQKTMELFILASRAGDFGRAAHALDLQHIPHHKQAELGPRYARELKAVLDRKLWLDFDTISDEPEGHPEDGSRTDHIGSIPLGHLDVPILVSRRAIAGGDLVWVVSSETVRRIPELYAAYGPSFIESHLPPVLTETRIWELALWQWIGLLLAVLVSAMLGTLVASLALRVAGRVASKTTVDWDDRLVELLRGPARMFVTLALTAVLIDPLRLSVPAQSVVAKLLQVGFIVTVAWVGQRVVQFVAEMIEQKAERMASEEEDDLRARGVRTQVRVLRRVAGIVIGVIASALILLQFEVVRSVGMSLLASAGVAGIVIGLAAQRSIATLLAGIQLSLTQPIRIGDTVIVEGEWGQIEEINLTYVVVRVWDQRRLVVPMSRFLEQSFENWTKVSPELLGTVFIHADYRIPVDAVREELQRIVEGNPNWDGRVQGVVVTNATDRTVELRPLVSAKNASAIWVLRCEVREKLIAWLQRYEGGRYLPRTRVDVEPELRVSTTSVRGPAQVSSSAE